MTLYSKEKETHQLCSKQRFGSVNFFTDPDPTQKPKADPDPGEILHAKNENEPIIFLSPLFGEKKLEECQSLTRIGVSLQFET